MSHLLMRLTSQVVDRQVNSPSRIRDKRQQLPSRRPRLTQPPPSHRLTTPPPLRVTFRWTTMTTSCSGSSWGNEHAPCRFGGKYVCTSLWNTREQTNGGGRRGCRDLGATVTPKLKLQSQESYSASSRRTASAFSSSLRGNRSIIARVASRSSSVGESVPAFRPFSDD